MLPSADRAWNCHSSQLSASSWEGHLGKRLPELGMNGVGGMGLAAMEEVMVTSETRFVVVMIGTDELCS